VRDPELYIGHILDCIGKIESFTLKVTEEEFYRNFLIQDAVIRNIQVIGEASKKFEQHFRDSNPQIPWRKITAMRNKVVHEYFGIDLPAVWNVVADDLSELKAQMISLRNNIR
jgi:uncharacterized protein with HEPN domain